LDDLLRDGQVEKGRDGRWRARTAQSANLSRGGGLPGVPVGLSDPDVIVAAQASFSRTPVSADLASEQVDDSGVVDPQALLRYWRSALRADPRGATTQVGDKHGVEWALISGRGPITPPVDENLTLTLDLAAVNPAFREALVRREGNENALAVGWPMAVARRGGAPIFLPVGLLVASWERTEGNLVLQIDACDESPFIRCGEGNRTSPTAMLASCSSSVIRRPIAPSLDPVLFPQENHRMFSSSMRYGFCCGERAARLRFRPQVEGAREAEIASLSLGLWKINDLRSKFLN